MAELSQRYAMALYDIAAQSDRLDEFYEQAVYARGALDMDECRRVLAHRLLAPAQKREFLQTLFGDGLNADIMALFSLAIDKRREVYILPALDTFIGMLNSIRRETTANVVSASPLSAEQTEALTSLLSRKLNKHVSVVASVDTSLLGGIIIHVDGLLIDRSIRKRLSDLIFSMKRGNAG